MVFKQYLKMRKNIFVFVACGDDVHIKTLNYSLIQLKHFSNHEIMVVSDLSRNNLKINHNNLLDIETPKKFNNHQASIYLKVGLHKILDLNNNYCYLDSDVVAVSSKVNEVFKHFKAPIVFASDHCNIAQFSPNAINCNCLEKRNQVVSDLQALEKYHKEHFDKLRKEHNIEWEKFIVNSGLTDQALFEKYQEVIGICEEFGLRFNRLTNIPFIRFLLSHIRPKKFNFEYEVEKSGKFKWDRNKRCIYDMDNNLIFDDFNKFDYKKYQYVDYYTFISQKTNYNWDEENTTWKFQDGKEVYIAQCDHLKNAIKRKFGTSINSIKWRHWNGGVFLFNQNSVKFMDKWLNKTLEVFKDPHWKTRDQGTLIATVWELGLQQQIKLPSTFNFLADSNNTNLLFDPVQGFSSNGFQTSVKPYFIHVYHNFGLKGWNVWDYIESTIPSKAQPDLKTNNTLAIKNNKVINGLWIGSKLSQVELLTIKSFLHHGHDFHLWVYDKIETELPKNVTIRNAEEIIPRENVFSYENTNQFGHGKGSFAGFSDIFRYKLLFDHGGWWVDMDVCCLKPFDFNENYVFRTHHQLLSVGNIMKCPKGSPLMKSCYEEAIKTVNSANTDWHKPINILNHYIKKLDLKCYIKEISNHDQWHDIYPLLTKNKHPEKEWFAIHWANENWRIKNLSKYAFRVSSTISILMNRYDVKHEKISFAQRISSKFAFSSIYSKLKMLKTEANF